MSKPVMSGTKTEIACIVSLVTIFIVLELNFGIFRAFSVEMSRLFPNIKEYYTALVGGCGVGLCFFSYRRRVDLNREIKTRLSVEKDFELYQICDAITGLPNRVGLNSVLNEHLANVGSNPFSLLGIEIRNHDTIAGVHGVECAERVEIAIANRLATLVEPDDYVSHGDQAKYYVIVTGSMSEERLIRIGNIIDSVSEYANAGIDTIDLKLQAYLSFATIDSQMMSGKRCGLDANEVMQRVDFALFKARSHGHGMVEHFDDEMEAALCERAQVEASLNNGIHNEQIVPYFQPFINMENNKVAGFEILARWEHPVRGQISPGTFIPIAQDAGILGAITLSILKQACVAACGWPDHIKLAINVSPTDLSNVEMIDNFMQILHETGINPNRIEVEITESAFIEEADDISGAITKLKSAGTSISIDDFGTGYSSLHHLRILPFDKIKIDQSFVKNMTNDSESRAIVEMVIALSKSLGLPITAEGIEHEKNHKLLKELGCTIGQGYLFAKALPAFEVEPFLKNFEIESENVGKAA
ncbi:MAG: EAL domain-containing protein [Hyphomicrobiales bacterium]|nr:EAL domain-containing protein [Hyphomicrobiales bacterium]